jgi:hypothetical protein
MAELEARIAKSRRPYDREEQARGIADRAALEAPRAATCELFWSAHGKDPKVARFFTNSSGVTAWVTLIWSPAAPTSGPFSLPFTKWGWYQLATGQSR